MKNFTHHVNGAYHANIPFREPKFHQPKLIIWAVASHDAEGQAGLRLHLGAMLMLLHRSVDGLQATSCCDQSLGAFDSNVWHCELGKHLEVNTLCGLLGWILCHVGNHGVDHERVLLGEPLRALGDAGGHGDNLGGSSTESRWGRLRSRHGHDF